MARKVLGLFHSQEKPALDAARIHKFLEMPFNHLGYAVDYWDLKQGTPPASRLDADARVGVSLKITN